MAEINFKFENYQNAINYSNFAINSLNYIYNYVESYIKKAMLFLNSKKKTATVIDSERAFMKSNKLYKFLIMNNCPELLINKAIKC